MDIDEAKTTLRGEAVADLEQAQAVEDMLAYLQRQAHKSGADVDLKALIKDGRA